MEDVFQLVTKALIWIVGAASIGHFMVTNSLDVPSILSVMTL